MGIKGIGVDSSSWNDVLPKSQVAGKEVSGKKYTKEEMLQMISDKKEEMYEKVKNNETETSFQIGGQSFTVKEWNKMLEQFDAVQQEIREQMKEEQAKRQKETTTKVSVETETSVTSKDSTNIAKTAGVFTMEKSEAGDMDDESVMDSLVTESTTCTYPVTEEKNSEEMYITWYTSDGIFCRKAGQTEGYFWSLSFKNSEQYERVMDFLGRIKADADYRFAAHENFWQDFLQDAVDEEHFLDFVNGPEEKEAEGAFAKYMD